MKNANTKSRASSVSKLRARLLKSWAAVIVLAASLLFIGLLTGCPNGSGPNRPNEPDQPPAKPVDPILKTDGHGKITGYKCAKEELPSHLVIPAKIGDEEIKEIGRYAFEDCTGLTSVHLPASLTKIGYCAFRGCTGLTSISLPANLTTIGEYAFYSCTGLTSVHLPANLTEIGEAAFEGCTGLTSLTIDSANAKYKTEGNILYNKAGTTLIFAAGGLTSANIPDTVTTIGVGAFASCTGLTSISLPANLTEIGKYAFYECTGLTSIRLPANLAQIGRGAFYGCEGLTSAVFADKNNWKVYDDEAHTQNETEINSSDLDNAATAAKYLLETYADKYWKKN